MLHFSYLYAELRRRWGRTLLTALGLAVGIGLVVVVNALSTGLDEAQDEVLKPLTGVGTDVSVSRPLEISGDGGGGGFAGPQLSAKEREQLERENGGARIGLRDLGEPGTKFTRDSFLATAQLSFPATQVDEIAQLDGVTAAAGGLTLTSIHLEGTVPERPAEPRTFGPGGGGGPPEDIDLQTITVTGVDQRSRELGALSPGQVSSGRYFRSGKARQAILNVSYAGREGLEIGDTIRLAGNRYTVVGLAETPLGGQSADVYVKLGELQALSKQKGRVNTVYVRTADADAVASVAAAIERTFPGSSVTTAEDLAERVTGSLVDARDLVRDLGTAMSLLGLLAAFLIASLLTLASVTKRIRELGTLKAIGWSQGRVVRQVAGESLLSGVLGGLLGVAVGLGAAALIGAFGPSLEATVAQEAAPAGPRFIGAFGQGTVAAGSTDVALGAPVSAALVLAATGLALLGGLVAGGVGGLRAARLRPADALRHID